MKKITVTLLACILMITVSARAEKKLQILPTPVSDRTFQYVEISETFMGTPLAIEAVVPHALFVIGAEESADLFIQTAGMAYMIGQWTQDPGTSIQKIKQNDNLAPVALDKDLTEEDIKEFNIVLVGTKNIFYQRIKDKLTGDGSFIQVIKDGLAPGRDVLFVSDKKSAFYLANKRLYFKSGAYKGFFNFVKIRLLIEQDNYEEALFSLDNPEGVRGCGKPVILAIGHKENLSPKMLAVAKKRNKIVFKDLRQELVARNKAKAIEVWHSAMETCYACHQGRDGVEKYRKYTPNKGEHSYHQVIVKKLGFECSTCHSGTTLQVGYDR